MMKHKSAIFGVALVLGIVGMAAPKFWAEAAEMKKEPAMKVKTLSYGEIIFTAPNVLPSPFHVIAKKHGKILWQINNSVNVAELTEVQKRELKAGGIDRLEVKKVMESDLDRGADNYQELKQYIKKLALYIWVFSRSSG
jgi:hypothetical protein